MWKSHHQITYFIFQIWIILFLKKLILRICGSLLLEFLWLAAILCSRFCKYRSIWCQPQHLNGKHVKIAVIWLLQRLMESSETSGWNNYPFTTAPPPSPQMPQITDNAPGKWLIISHLLKTWAHTACPRIDSMYTAEHANVQGARRHTRPIYASQ